MVFWKIAFCLLFFAVSMPQAYAEDISSAAKRIARQRDKKAELEKNDVKSGQQIGDIGTLSIDDFLELEAVPDGMDAASADSLYNADSAFDFMTTEQAVKSIAAMRAQGIELPEDLEKNIRKDPDKKSRLMSQAFASIPPANVENKDDIAKQRRDAIYQAEGSLGISFKDVLENQKNMMTTLPSDNAKKRAKRN